MTRLRNTWIFTLIFCVFGLQPIAEARRLAIMIVGGGSRTERGAVDLLKEEIPKYKFLKANNWEIKFLWPFRKNTAVRHGIAASDIRYSTEWRLAYEIKKAAYGSKKYGVQKLTKGDQFLLWMNTHGAVGHNSIGPGGAGQYFEYNQSAVQALLNKIKENEATLGFYVSACYGGMMVDAMADLGCAISNGSSQFHTSTESREELTHINSTNLSDYSMHDWYLNLLKSSYNLPESNSDTWGRNLHTKILNLVHDDSSDPHLETATPAQQMGYGSFHVENELEKLRKRIMDQKVWDKITNDRSFSAEPANTRMFYPITQNKINTLVADAIRHNPDNYWAETNRLYKEIQQSTEQVFGQQKNPVLHMNFNFTYAFPKLYNAQPKTIENIVRRAIPVDFQIAEFKSKNNVYLGYTQDLFTQYALHPDVTDFRKLAIEFARNIQKNKFNIKGEVYDELDYLQMIQRLEIVLRRMVEEAYQSLTYGQRQMLRTTAYLYEQELMAYNEAKKKDDAGYAKLWKESYTRVQKTIGYRLLNSVQYLHAMSVQTGALPPFNSMEKNSIQACKNFKLSR